MLALVALGVVASVVYTMRPRELAAPPPKIDRLDPKATIETRGGDVVQLKGERQNLRVEFAGQTTNTEGETQLHDVKIMVDNRGGRNYVITGKRAFVGKQNSSYDVRGDVKMVTSDGLTMLSQQATYVDAEKMVRAPGQVTFASGRMTGSGIGFTYDEQRDTMWILEQADVKFAAEGDAGPIAVTAGRFGYARRDRYMRFENTMHMDREGQLIDANESTVRLFPDRDEADYVELRGNSRVTGETGTLRSMSARDINLDYADDGRTLQNVALAGQTEIRLSTKDGSGGQRLDGEFMEIGLEPDGSVRSLSTRDAVTVTLPASKTTGARTIKATALTAAGTAQGMSEMKFIDGVEYREAATRTQAARVAKARTLEAQLDPASGLLQEARFSGNFEFTDGPLHAVGTSARYRILEGTLALAGKEITPEISDEALTLLADSITVTLDPRRMTASGNIRSTLLPPKKPTGNTPATKRPGLLAEKDPVTIVSDALTYDEAERKAEYSGKTVLVQGETTINSTASMTLDEAKGDLMAAGAVITNLALTNKTADAGARPKPAESKSAESTPAAAKPTETGKEKPAGTITKPKPTIARAASFNYSDQTRMATYTTGALLDGEQGNLSAGKIELQLAKDANTLERLEATLAVTAIVDRRTVTGTRLTYSTSEEKYVVVGAPVKMVDADCQETNGKTLTFWKASDRVQVDGNNEVRTQTKGGVKTCVVALPPK